MPSIAAVGWVPAAGAGCGSSHDSTDCSQVIARGLAPAVRSGPVRASCAWAAARTSATTCLQSNPTGQLHWPWSNSSTAGPAGWK